MDVKSTYILLKTSLFFILLITGYNLSKQENLNSKRYWIIASISIIAYSLIEGLRYDRGIDYMNYKKIFEYSLNIQGNEIDGQIESLFLIFNKFFRFLGFSYPYIFVFYSLILIIAGFYFIKEHQDVAFVAVPFFLISTISQSENLVRQYMAFSFILFSFRFLLNNSWMKFGVLITLAIFIHTSTIFVLPFLILFKYLKKPFGNLYIILALYFLSWLWKPEYWGSYYHYFQNLTIFPEVYRDYLEDADIWLSGEKLLDVNSHFPMLSTTKTVLFNTGMIILGYRILDTYRYKNYPLYYSLYVIGAISQRLTYRMELFHRISLIYYMFWFIVLGYIIYDSFGFKSKNSTERIVCYFLILSVLYEYFITIIRVNPSHSLFIWS